MRSIEAKEITAAIARLCREANYYLGEDVKAALHKSQLTEESVIGQEILSQLVENCQIAAAQQMPVCQDTGLTVIFLEIGQDLHIEGGDLNQAVQEGVRQGYQNLRKSIVAHPLKRINTGDNTPAVIHTEIVPGQQLTIRVAP
ncbi:MAG: fumarate hydratase, partial [Clostridia bacterium]|nr:fumarate hydratase [Clostridia bacterium]